MAESVGYFPNRPFRLQITVILKSQNVTANTSLVEYSVAILKNSYSPTQSSATSFWSSNIGPVYREGSFTYNFVNSDVLILSAGTQTINHAADGTASVVFNAGANVDIMGSTSAPNATLNLPTIPRASTPSLSPSTVPAGTSTTINTNRASTGFTHTLQYNFGSSGWVNIATGVGASTTWTPPLSLLNSIPNSPTGNGLIRCITYSGSTQIGTKDVSFTLSTPSSVIPTWTSVSVSEGVSAVATNVGAYVQNVSKLSHAIVGAAGVYGSSITLRRFTASGQTVDGATGTTPAVISSSGTVPVTWLIQDSRGKQKTQTTNITVLPYTTPTIVSANVQRALSNGTVDVENGTYLRVDLNAVVQSLMNTTQRNTLQIKVRARVVGSTTPWTDASTLKSTLNPGGVSYNSNTTVTGPFAVDTAYEVRIEVLDLFNTSSYQTTISVGAVFMHWDDVGVGIGKFRQNGVLDVNGDIYSDGDIRADGGVYANTKLLLPGATASELLAGTSNVVAVTPQRLFDVPRFRATGDSGTAQNCASGSWYQITTTFGTTAWNEDFTSWSGGVLTVATSGIYRISLQLGWVSGGTAGRLFQRVTKNNTDATALNDVVLGSNGYGINGFFSSCTFRLTAGDQLRVFGYQESGVTKEVDLNRLTYFEVAWIAP
jgi:hypothetical protein